MDSLQISKSMNFFRVVDRIQRLCIRILQKSYCLSKKILVPHSMCMVYSSKHHCHYLLWKYCKARQRRWIISRLLVFVCYFSVLYFHSEITRAFHLIYLIRSDLIWSSIIWFFCIYHNLCANVLSVYISTHFAFIHLGYFSANQCSP